MVSSNGRSLAFTRRDALRYGGFAAGGAIALTRGGLYRTNAQDAAPITVPDFQSEVEASDVSLTLWTFVETHARWFEAMAAAYQAQVNPGFELEVVQTAYEDHHNKLLVSFQAGGVGAPDFADIEQGRFGAFMKGQPGFIDLTDRLTSGGYNEQIVPTREALYSIQGRVYGVEHALCPVGLYYRSDLYEALGVTMPFATWADWIAATKQLTGENVYGTRIDWDLYDMVLRQRGSDTFDAQGACVADSPIAIETLEWLLNLRGTENVAQEVPDGAQAFGTAVDQSTYGAIRDGKFVALAGADWYGGFLRDNVAELSGKWKEQFLPAWEAGGARTSVLGGTGLTIGAASKNQDVAWDFLRYAMLTSEGNVQQYLNINLWPQFKPAWDDARMKSADPYFNNQVLGDLYAEIGGEAPAQNQSVNRADFAILRRDKYTRDIFDGKISPAEGLTNLANEIRKLTR